MSDTATINHAVRAMTDEALARQLGLVQGRQITGAQRVAVLVEAADRLRGYDGPGRAAPSSPLDDRADATRWSTFNGEGLLTPGRKYRVRYIMQGRKLEREMVATYLGTSEHGPTQLDWSGRPAFGTTQLRFSDVTRFQPVAQDTDCYVERKVQVGS